MIELKNFIAVPYTEHGYGSRIGLFLKDDLNKIKVNPRNELGKFGIRISTAFGDFIQISVADKTKTGKVSNFYLNRKSTIKWINAQIDTKYHLPLNAKSKNIETALISLPSWIKELEDSNSKKIQNLLESEEKVPECLPHLNHRTLDSSSDKFKAAFWNKFYRWSLQSWTKARLRFGLNLSEKTIAKASAVLAVSAFKQALSAPAYQKHIKENVASWGLNDFASLPITSKDNFIKKAQNILNDTDLYLGGKLPEKAKRDTSTGTTGKSTSWWRGKEEQDNVQKVMVYASKIILGDKPFTAINGFALGPWATGITGTLAFSSYSKASISANGPNTSEILETITEVVRMRGKEHPIAVAGYPPYIRALVEQAIEFNISLHEYNLYAVVGGEAMSENQRDLIVQQVDDKGNVIRTGFKHCYSSYGASDLDINIGYESDFEIELRKICFQKPELAKELFGENQGIPMIFHYDPLNYHIEYDEDHHLIYTCVRLDRISPRVKYSLGDKGKTMPVSDVLAALDKFDIKMNHKPMTNLPMLFIWGRDGELISFRASKVYPSNVADTIKRMNDAFPKKKLNERILHHGIYQYEHEGKVTTEFLLEIDTASEKKFAKFGSKFLKQFLQYLQISNTDISANLNNCPDEEKPVLRLFKKGKSPMHQQQAENPHKKKQYIFGVNLKEQDAKSLHKKIKKGKLVTVLDNE